MYAILSSLASSRITKSPTRLVDTSRSPSERSRSTTWSTALSISSVATGRLRSASIMLPISLSRSKSVRLPSFFTSRGILRSTRSYVVKRFSHAAHLRRRRVVLASRFARVSITWVSSEPQKGHFIAYKRLFHLSIRPRANPPREAVPGLPTREHTYQRLDERTEKSHANAIADLAALLAAAELRDPVLGSDQFPRWRPVQQGEYPYLSDAHRCDRRQQHLCEGESRPHRARRPRGENRHRANRRLFVRRVP